MRYCNNQQEDCLSDEYKVTEDIDNIEWDYLEDKYIDNQGNIYKTIEDIPENYRQYIKPIKPIKPFKVRYVKGVKINSN